MPSSHFKAATQIPTYLYPEEENKPRQQQRGEKSQNHS